MPSNEEIARLRDATGAGRLVLNPAALTVRKTRPDVRCDLSSVAPGYATDRLWTELADRGFTDFLVDVGGELRTRGRNEAGAPWQIAIERPQPHGDAIQRLVPSRIWRSPPRGTTGSIAKSTASGSRTFSIRGPAVR